VTELLVQVCPDGHAVFPPRVLCPRCGSREWHEAPAGPGTVEGVTSHRAGGCIASVRLEIGPVVVARAAAGAAVGDGVRLANDAGAPAIVPGG
jgi:uncharacterized OB-fold protein